MEGWLSREGTPGTLFDDRSIYSRRLLPQVVARLQAEGGAPYLHSYGRPSYASDSHDCAETYPMEDAA